MILKNQCYLRKDSLSYFDALNILSNDLGATILSVDKRNPLSTIIITIQTLVTGLQIADPTEVKA